MAMTSSVFNGRPFSMDSIIIFLTAFSICPPLMLNRSAIALDVALVHVRQHASPYLLSYLCGRAFKLNVIEETSMESRVEVVCQIGCGYEYALEVLHVLEQDVLHGVSHLLHFRTHSYVTLAEDGVCLIEEKDGGKLGLRELLSVIGKDALYVFLRFAHPHALL